MSTKTPPKPPVARPQKAAVVPAPPAPVKEVAQAGATAGFVIETGIPLPAITRKNAKSSLYPIDLLEVGQSFFAAETVKKMASVANSATKRFSVALEGETRKKRDGSDVQAMQKTRVFEVRVAQKDGVDGARVFRTA